MPMLFRLCIAVASLVWLFSAHAAPSPATAVATITQGFVTGITLTSGGSGYKRAPEVALLGGGGKGATARSFLSGDAVSAIIVLSAGSGYTNAPAVIIEPPPQPWTTSVRLVPQITIRGQAGNVARVEWTDQLGTNAVWNLFTNVLGGGEGVKVVDLEIADSPRFYRAVDGGVCPCGAAGEPPGVRPQGFVWIPPGINGTLTNKAGFWMSDHETTQDEFVAVMGFNPSWFTTPITWTNIPGTSPVGMRPVERVNFTQATTYCTTRTVLDRAAGLLPAGYGYRLPTSEEWEYAARAGTRTAYYWGDDAGEMFKYARVGSADFYETTYAVGGKLPNAWGLYDMIGNAREWVNSGNDAFRILRGGFYSVKPVGYELIYWGPNDTIPEHYAFGFRPILVPVP